MTSVSTMSQDQHSLGGHSGPSSIRSGQSGLTYEGVCYCQALYDYSTVDPSSLSFEAGDVLEVHTQLESGWWDGYLGPNGPRGWFPSNYVKLITFEQAEDALLASQTPHQAEFIPAETSRTRSRSRSDTKRSRKATSSKSHSRSGSESSLDAKSSHDFWQPEMTPDGKVRSCHTISETFVDMLNIDILYQYCDRSAVN